MRIYILNIVVDREIFVFAYPTMEKAIKALKKDYKQTLKCEGISKRKQEYPDTEYNTWGIEISGDKEQAYAWLNYGNRKYDWKITPVSLQITF